MGSHPVQVDEQRAHCFSGIGPLNTLVRSISSIQVPIQSYGLYEPHPSWGIIEVMLMTGRSRFSPRGVASDRVSWKRPRAFVRGIPSESAVLNTVSEREDGASEVTRVFDIDADVRGRWWC
jgi:hypothetical protein